MLLWSDSSESATVVVNDMTALMSGHINDLNKVIKTKSSQSLFG